MSKVEDDLDADAVRKAEAEVIAEEEEFDEKQIAPTIRDTDIPSAQYGELITAVGRLTISFSNRE